MSSGLRLIACVVVLVALLGVRGPMEPKEKKIFAYISNFLPGMVLPSDTLVLPDGRHRMDRCVLRFTERQFRRLRLPYRHLRHVRFSVRIPAIGEDTPGYLALSSGFAGITRGNQVFISPLDFGKAMRRPETRAKIDKLGLKGVFSDVLSLKGEELFFHELVHTAQYAEGMDVVRYGSASIEGLAGSMGAHTGNAYEQEANRLGDKLLKRWHASADRKRCLERRSPGANWEDGLTQIAFRS